MAHDAVLKTLRFLTLPEKNLEVRDGKELGRGAYGRVFTVKYCGHSFAAKEIQRNLLDGVSDEERDAVVKSFLQECYHCVNLRHPNIVQFIGVYWSQWQQHLPVMVMEMMECSLTSFIHDESKCNIKYPTDKYSVLHHVALGLAYLHGQSPPVIHRDLTPNNILLTNSGVAKIGDLGVVKVIQAGGEVTQRNIKLTKAPGMVDFIPPEALCDNPVYDTSSDVFSFGGIALFIFSKQWPSPVQPREVDSKNVRNMMGFTEIQRRQKYLNKIPDDDDGSQDLRHIVKSCLDNDPRKRPGIRTVAEKIEGMKIKMNSQQVSVKPSPLVRPRPKLRHIRSLPNVMVASTDPCNDAAGQHSHLSPPVVAPRARHHSSSDLSNLTPSRGRRFFQELPTLGEALQNDKHRITWTRCADLPAPMYGASVAVSDQYVYVTAGVALDYHIYQRVFRYDITNDCWSRLPSPEQSLGILFMVDGKLNILGGNSSDNNATNRVFTFDPDTNKWIGHYPDMLKSRILPGVAVYLQHVIVAGGAEDKTSFHDDIEILNSQQSPLQWKRVDITLPVPMWTISLTISGDKLLIVGYNQAKGRSTSVYQLPVRSLFKQPQLHTDQLKWVKLCSAPHHGAALVPRSNPAVIVGGNFRGCATANISVYNGTENRWTNCSSLSSPRINVAVASIYNDAIIVFGGHTSGANVEAAMESSLTTVEIGKVEAIAKPEEPIYIEATPRGSIS